MTDIGVKFVLATADDPKPDFAEVLGRKVAKMTAEAEARGRMGGWADAIEHLRQGALLAARPELAFAAEYLVGLGVPLPETAPSAPSEPVQDQPRVWELPTIPEDVTRLRDRDGGEWCLVELEMGRFWVGTEKRGSGYYSIVKPPGLLLAEHGPLAEVVNTDGK